MSKEGMDTSIACLLCLEDLEQGDKPAAASLHASSPTPSAWPPGSPRPHMMHLPCLTSYLQSGYRICPVCRIPLHVSLLDWMNKPALRKAWRQPPFSWLLMDIFKTMTGLEPVFDICHDVDAHPLLIRQTIALARLFGIDALAWQLSLEHAAVSTLALSPFEAFDMAHFIITHDLWSEALFKKSWILQWPISVWTDAIVSASFDPFDASTTRPLEVLDRACVGLSPALSTSDNLCVIILRRVFVSHSSWDGHADNFVIQLSGDRLVPFLKGAFPSVVVPTQEQGRDLFPREIYDQGTQYLSILGGNLIHRAEDAHDLRGQHIPWSLYGPGLTAALEPVQTLMLIYQTQWQSGDPDSKVVDLMQDLFACFPSDMKVFAYRSQAEEAQVEQRELDDIARLLPPGHFTWL